MRRKLALDALAVDSFATSSPGAEPRGTVRAHADACTCNATCACKTAEFYCGTIIGTAHSCDYTHNESCAYVTYTTCTA